MTRVGSWNLQIVYRPAASDGFAGSDIQSALHEIGESLHLDGPEEARQTDFILGVVTNTVPLSRTNPEQIEDIRAWGRERAVPAGSSNLPSAPGQATSGRRVLVLGDS